jgi:hypothetical protein
MSDFPEGMPLRDAPNVEERFLELIEDSSASQMKGTMQWRPGTKKDPANDANMLSIMQYHHLCQNCRRKKHP